MARRRRNPGTTFFHEHPWMTFFLGGGVLYTARVIIRGWEPTASAATSAPSTDFKIPGATTISVGPGSLPNLFANVGDTIHLTVPAYDPVSNPQGSVMFAAPGMIQMVGPQDYKIVGTSNSIHAAWGAGAWGAAGEAYIDSTGLPHTLPAASKAISSLMSLYR